jgi:hypothetical protein
MIVISNMFFICSKNRSKYKGPKTKKKKDAPNKPNESDGNGVSNIFNVGPEDLSRLNQPVPQKKNLEPPEEQKENLEPPEKQKENLIEGENNTNTKNQPQLAEFVRIKIETNKIETPKGGAINLLKKQEDGPQGVIDKNKQEDGPQGVIDKNKQEDGPQEVKDGWEIWTKPLDMAEHKNTSDNEENNKNNDQQISSKQPNKDDEGQPDNRQSSKKKNSSEDDF